MTRFLILTYTYFLSHKKQLICLLAFLIFGFVLSLLRLEYKEDIAEFLPNNKANERITSVYQHIGSSNKLIINFSAKDSTLHNSEHIIEAIEQFATSLSERDSLHIIPEIISQVDESKILELTKFIQENIPYFLIEDDYSRIDTLLTKAYLTSNLEEDKRQLMLPSGNLLKQNMIADPLHLFSPLLLKLKDFQINNNAEIIDGHLFFHGGKKGMLLLTSPYGISESAGNTKLLEIVNQTIEQIQKEFPNLRISCFGAPAIAVANANQIKTDSVLSISLAVILIFSLLIYFFRNGRNLFFLFFSVLFGWIFSLGSLALFMDQISVIAIGISSIFVGIAVNYPLHLIAHLQHEKNIKRSLKEIIPPLLIGNITTVGAFLSLLFINSPALRDLGLFGSLLLIGTVLFVLVFLPHLIKTDKQSKEVASPLFKKLASFAPERNKWVVCVVLVLTVVFLFLSQSAKFDSDMNSINYMTEAQREDMNDMLQSLEQNDKSTVYMISEGEQMDNALSFHEQSASLLDSLQQTGIIKSISGIGIFLPSQEEQKRRIDRWNKFWEIHRDSLLLQIDNIATSVGFKQGAFSDFSQLLHTDFTPQPESYFSPITSLLAENYLIRESNKNRVVNLLYCEKEDTESLKNALSEGLTARKLDSHIFFFDTRNIGELMVDFLSQEFNYVLFFCGMIVFVFLTISFGRLELSVLSFLPLAVSWIWILGIMQLWDIHFNIVSIILATFIFGQGDDYTIFITEGLMHEYTYKRKVLDSYKKSIVLSSLIMFIGIGTLIFSKHPAMHSLAEVTIIGMFSVVMMAYIIPPFIFKWLTTNKEGLRKVPVTFKRLGFSVYAFIAFLTGSLIITIIGLWLFCFNKNNETKKVRYHSILRSVAHWVIRHIPGVKFNYENLSDETFDKPAIIISNHQSHLDLMCLIMLHPKLIVLTNDWVWNNPFYGRLIKYADFYPISNGIEQNIQKLSERVQKGYSIVVFPEGTRSSDCSILRFHRGAFYLAEQLNLDVIPIFIHGVGHVLPKTDFMLQNGIITVQVHPRIQPKDSRFADSYAIRTKQVRHYYRDTFTAISKQLETSAYFKSFVLHNYIYKGVEIEREAKKEFMLLEKSGKLNTIDNYHGTGPVLILNNKYGIYSFLFALVHKDIQVIALEQEEDKVLLARNCSGLPQNLKILRDNEFTEEVTFENVIDVQKLINNNE